MFHLISLAAQQVITGKNCYVCAEGIPQFEAKLHDKRLVSYCGDCWDILQDGLQVWRDNQ